MRIDVSEAIEAIDTLIAAVKFEVKAATEEMAAYYLERLKKQTNYPFQSVPSYLLAWRFKKDKYGNPIKARKYPQGTLATFAVGTGSSFKKSNLDVFTGQKYDIVQQGPAGKETAFHKLLTTSETVITTSSGRVIITADVGFGKNVEKEHRSIPLVYYGTPGVVIPRPIIERIIYANRAMFADRIAKAVEKVLNNVDLVETTRTTGHAAGLPRDLRPSSMPRLTQFRDKDAQNFGRPRTVTGPGKPIPPSQFGAGSGSANITLFLANKVDKVITYNFRNLFGFTNLDPKLAARFNQYRARLRALTAPPRR